MKRKGSAAVVIIIIVLLILILIGWIWYHETHEMTASEMLTASQSVSSSSLALLDTSGWNTYVNTSSDPEYQIQYPSGWYGVYKIYSGQGTILITSTSSPNIEENNPPGSHELYLYAPFENAEPGLSIASVTPQTFSAYEGKVLSYPGKASDFAVVSTSSLVVDGKPAFQYEENPGHFDVVDILLHTSVDNPFNGNEVLSVSLNPTLSSSDQELFNTIVSTIHFLN